MAAAQRGAPRDHEPSPSARQRTPCPHPCAPPRLLPDFSRSVAGTKPDLLSVVLGPLLAQLTLLALLPVDRVASLGAVGLVDWVRGGRRTTLRSPAAWRGRTAQTARERIRTCGREEYVDATEGWRVNRRHGRHACWWAAAHAFS
eukprot:762463-Prymnesium_polylepis.2